jgi:hypothetical protein
MVAIVAIGGLAAIGSIRAAQLLMPSVHVLRQGASLAALPEAVRALSRSLGNLLRLATAASLGLAAVCLAWGIAALLVPDDVGSLLLGDVWPSAQTFLPASICAQLGVVLVLGPGMMIRAFANARLSPRVTVVTATVGISVPVVAAFAGGLAAAWGLAFASVVGAAIWWLALPSGIRTWRQTGTTSERAPA